jgi:xanthine dehydrogenase iron-sulfur cluster and FAD-binding subunit A
VEESTINACLALLCSVDGCAVTTTEGLKTAKNGCHAVHKRLAGFHGSQCGFCTPGMSMSIYGGLRKAAAANAENHGSNGHNGVEKPCGLSAQDATKAINGNICRCTGYRPILDTCRSFAGDVDVEDLGVNAFWNSSDKADAALLPHYNPEEDPKFPSFLVDELKSRSEDNSLTINHVEGKPEATVARRQWFTATSLSNAFELLKTHSDGKQEVKLVVGNTSAGVYKNIKPEVYIDISHIPELFVVKASNEFLQVGAGVPLSKLINLLVGESAKSKSVVYDELAKHVGQIASEQVRNRASLGGNLILAQRFGFDSDLATILLGAGTEVTLASTGKGETTISLEEFLSQDGPESAARILVCPHPQLE